MTAALLISVTFPRGGYSGGELGAPEALPSPARLHAAFAGAAAGGPWAEVKDGVLTARREHAQTVRWLEENEPLGLLAPRSRQTDYAVSRYRSRAAVNHLNETVFEPFSALDGPVVYVWPPAAEDVLKSLKTLAQEITHIGTADGLAIVEVTARAVDLDDPRFAGIVPGRGPGLALRVPTGGRFDALVSAHRTALKAGGHGAGSRGKQAIDQQPLGAEDRHTRLRRFATSPPARWPYTEAWCLALSPSPPKSMMRAEWRVPLAVAVHRAIVAAIGSDVPGFVTGRDGAGPMRGSGHLAVHVTTLGQDARPTVILALPLGIAEADRATLLEAVARRPNVTFARRTLRLGTPELRPAMPFWQEHTGLLSTEIPMVLDAPGVPRHAPWTLEDAVICSVGYAMRGVLEAEGVEWGGGWEFRRALVTQLRERGVDARARRVNASASRYAHRAREGDLLVAVDAAVSLGQLGGASGGLLALGRSRHLGGGLLRPLVGGSP